jgi:hypothetical protein
MLYMKLPASKLKKQANKRKLPMVKGKNSGIKTIAKNKPAIEENSRSNQSLAMVRLFGGIEGLFLAYSSPNSDYTTERA